MRQTRSLSLMCALTVLFAAAVQALGASTSPSSAPAQNVAVVRLEGKIDDYNARHFMKRFTQAKATGAKTIIVDIDTYGGLVTSGLELSRFIKGQNDVRVVCYIGQKAISAGAMIALACNEIVMSPSAQLGDCAPIAIDRDGRLQSLSKTEREKLESPIVDDFFDSATRNGYDPLLVKSMVVLDVAVNWVQSPDAGERRFVSNVERDTLLNQGWRDVRDPEVRSPVDADNTLLTVSTRSALRLGLAKAEFASVQSLAAARGYSIVGTFAPNVGDAIIEWLNHPLIRGLLIVLLFISIYAAFHAPGHGFAEFVAVITLATLVGVPLLTGHAQWWEIMVILIGVAVLALELFVIPGFGFVGLIGLMMIVFGLVMTFVGKEPAGAGVLPKLQSTWQAIRQGLAAVVGALLASFFVAMWLRKYLPKIPYFRRLILSTVTGGDAVIDANAITSDIAFKPALGAFGEAVTDLRPGGSVSFYDPQIADVRIMSVIAATGFLPRGTKVTVIENDHNRIRVRPRSADEAKN